MRPHRESESQPEAGRTRRNPLLIFSLVLSLMLALVFVLDWRYGVVRAPADSVLKPVQLQFRLCQIKGSARDQRACRNETFANMIDPQHPLTSLGKLDGTGFPPNCHGFGHGYGRSWMQGRTVEDARQLFSSIDSKYGDCTRGFIHGVQESGISSGQNIVFFAQSMCGELATSQLKLDCVHGLGHRLVITGNSASEATLVCKGFPDRAWSVECVAGVDMQVSGDEVLNS